jgi:poly(hydroxyalkanoate) granule-associated protein
MATRTTKGKRQQARKRPGGRAASSRTSKARAQARAGASQSQAQLLHGVQQVWLAGMGAIAKAQKEGPVAFQDAVVEGVRLLSKSRSTAQRMVRDAFENAQETLQLRVGGARDQAQETWDNLEALFQSRVQRAMHQLGVPTAEEIRALTRRVAELNASVHELSARKRGGKGAKAKRAAPRRSARRAARK